MQKLFRIKLEFETFIIAKDEDEAVREFWDNRDSSGESIDTFLEEVTKVDHIGEADEIFEELEEANK